MKWSIRIAALAIVCTLLVYSLWALDFTKTDAQINNWTAVGADTSVESSAIANTDNLGKLVLIDAASTSTNAVTAGEELLVIVWIKSGATDEFWHVLTQFKHSGTTANTQALAAASGPSQANPDRVELASTTNFAAQGAVYFLNDNTLASSEIVCCLDVATNDYMQAIDALVRDHDTSDAMYDQVSQWVVRLPPECQAARVTFHNRDDDATYAVRVRTAEISEIE
jgi:hypothetical protein